MSARTKGCKRVVKLHDVEHLPSLRIDEFNHSGASGRIAASRQEAEGDTTVAAMVPTSDPGLDATVSHAGRPATLLPLFMGDRLHPL